MSRGKERKKKMIKTTDEFKRFLNLQLFGDGDGAAGDGGNGDGTGEGGDDGSGNVSMSFDDFLKGEGNQAEFDRRIAKATQTAVKNARAKWELETDDKLSEAEKLARMSKEQKAEYKANKLQAELDEMKRKEAVAELTKTARKLLSDENINVPDELLTYIVGKDADETKASVEAFKKLFNETVSAELKKNARQETPPDGGGAAGGNSRADIREMAKNARIIK